MFSIWFQACHCSQLPSFNCNQLSASINETTYTKCKRCNRSSFNSYSFSTENALDLTLWLKNSSVWREHFHFSIFSFQLALLNIYLIFHNNSCISLLSSTHCLIIWVTGTGVSAFRNQLLFQLHGLAVLCEKKSRAYVDCCELPICNRLLSSVVAYMISSYISFTWISFKVYRCPSRSLSKNFGISQ